MASVGAPTLLRVLCPLGGLLFLGVVLVVNPAEFWRFAQQVHQALAEFRRAFNPSEWYPPEISDPSPNALIMTRLFGLVIIISVLAGFALAARA